MRSDQPNANETEAAAPPLGQRLYDNWPLLMVLGIAIMVLIYTGWGLWEIAAMADAPLP